MEQVLKFSKFFLDSMQKQEYDANHKAKALWKKSFQSAFFYYKPKGETFNDKRNSRTLRQPGF